MPLESRSLAKLFRYLEKVESQVALLRLDLQAAGVLPKVKIDVDLGVSNRCKSKTCGCNKVKP